MDTQGYLFLLILAASFAAFAGPFGRSLASQMEGDGPDERARDARRTTLVARFIGVTLVGYATWKLLNL